MKTRVLSLFLLLSLLSGLLVAPLTASAQADPKTASLPVTGTGTAPSGPVTFDGTFNIDKFDLNNGQLVAIGHLTGTITETVTGNKTNVPDREVTLPVQSINGSALSAGAGAQSQQIANADQSMAMLEMAQAAPACNILTLVLGPLHLDLLGLVVDLNQLTLKVTGQTGTANLLGNLLCAIAGLPITTPPSTGVLGVLINLLNALLGILRLGLAV